MQATATPFVPLHGLHILTPQAAHALGYESITIGISSRTEDEILASVAKGRNPQRTAWIKIGPDTYELGVKREDVTR